MTIMTNVQFSIKFSEELSVKTAMTSANIKEPVAPVFFARPLFQVFQRKGSKF